jgi:DNA-binding NtrC family response regulator
MPPRPTPLDILVVDDDADIAETIAEALQRTGHRPAIAMDGHQAIRQLHERTFDLLICDIRLPGVDGMSILRQVKGEQLGTAVIMMSAYGSIPEAVDAVKNDAVHYLAKPFSLKTLLQLVKEVEQRAGIEAVRDWARATIAESPERALIGETAVMTSLKQKLRTIARTEGPVLITGETGTGKELVASTIHALCRRGERPFVAINCAAFPDTLIEAELFGYERGAFTGAQHSREGRFAAAEGGTLFLDEVGEVSPSTQAKLLRVLENGSYQRLGSNVTHTGDVRTISATNVDLSQRIAQGLFRGDLYYRLKLFRVEVPALRERRADIALLVEHFCSELNAGGPPPAISPRAWAALLHYDYPGNVRELRHAVAHAVAMASGDTIDIGHLPSELSREPQTVRDGAVRPLREAEREFERSYILRALRETGWNRTRAAELLGVSRKTLWKKLRQLGLSSPEESDAGNAN